MTKNVSSSETTIEFISHNKTYRFFKLHSESVVSTGNSDVPYRKVGCFLMYEPVKRAS